MVGLKRVFVAVTPPLEARLGLAQALSRHKLPGKEVPPGNWHITLRFLGQVDDITCERFLGDLDQQDLGDQFDLGIEGLGAFPRAKRATVLWAGLKGDISRLTQLAMLAENSAQSAGLQPEDRPFHPHLTLSRIRPPEDVTGLVDGQEVAGVTWRCRDVVVYRSDLGGEHPRYETLESLALGG